MKFACLFFCCASWIQGQTPSDSQLLLNEVRQLRQDLAAISTSMQRTQIILYRLQLEEAAMTRATQRVDQTRSQAAGLQQRLRNQTDEIQAMEAELARTQDATQKARLPNMIAGLRKEIENWAPQVQDAQSKQIDAESQLRAEQAKRDALEAALERLDKQLAAGGH
jgi:chromosome segregation ATPase